MREERFLITKKLVYIYFIFTIPLAYIFYKLDQTIIVKLALIVIFLGGIYALVHKYLFKYVFRGGPNVASKPEDIKLISELKIYKPGLNVIEIGSGYGNISIALSKLGMNVTGIDINPTVVFTSKINAFFKGARNCKFQTANMWKFDYSKYDIAIVYCIGHAMGDLSNILFTQMKPGSYIISNFFKFPNIKEIDSSENIYIYRVGSETSSFNR